MCREARIYQKPNKNLGITGSVHSQMKNQMTFYTSFKRFMIPNVSKFYRQNRNLGKSKVYLKVKLINTVFESL